MKKAVLNATAAVTRLVKIRVGVGRATGPLKWASHDSPLQNMPIYTKTGDNGTTSLFGGKRVLKSDCNIEAYGSIDELTSIIGLIVSKEKSKSKKQLLINIQKDFHQIMAAISGADVRLTPLLGRINLFEQEMNKTESKLSKLNRFVLPGGTEMASLLHIARAVCRRAERNMVIYLKNAEQNQKNENYKLVVLPYLNRLSDLFFMLARAAAGNKEITI